MWTRPEGRWGTGAGCRLAGGGGNGDMCNSVNNKNKGETGEKEKYELPPVPSNFCATENIDVYLNDCQYLSESQRKLSRKGQGTSSKWHLTDSGLPEGWGYCSGCILKRVMSSPCIFYLVNQSPVGQDGIPLPTRTFQSWPR